MNTVYVKISKDELYHHGIKGQKWGRRRYQNPDGSLTPAGRQKYGVKGPRRFSVMASKSKYNKYLDNKHRVYRKSKIDSLSTSELKERTERLKAETAYMDALGENAKRYASAGKQATDIAMERIGKISDTSTKVKTLMENGLKIYTVVKKKQIYNNNK